MANKRIDQATGTQTVGHEWDGIEELNTPLPRWWLWTFYLSIVFAIGYVIAYPALPMLSRATQGYLGWSSRGQLDKELVEADKIHESVRGQLATMDIENLPGDPELMAAAVAGGAAAFKVNCVQCHGSGAAGNQQLGYPNLNDDDWLWGGDLKTIQYTITHGIRQASDDDLRQSAMPSFDGILDDKQVSNVVSYVRSLSGLEKRNAAGAQIFADNCASCHGPNGGGGREFGAPRLNDAIWLRGNTRDDLRNQILHPKMGAMPAWGGRLSPETIKMLTAYVHSLGGGEEAPATTATDTASDAAKATGNAQS